MIKILNYNIININKIILYNKRLKKKEKLK